LLTIFNEVYKISNLLQREGQGVSNQAFNRDNHKAYTCPTNVEEAENRAKQTLTKPVNTKDSNENQ